MHAHFAVMSRKERKRTKGKGKKLVDEGRDHWALGSPLRDVAAKKEQVTTALSYRATFVAFFMGSGDGQAKPFKTMK